MNSRMVIPAAAVWLAASTASWALDTIRTTGPTVKGRVVKQNAVEVTVEQGATTKTVPVNQIEAIYYDNEPTLLNTVRTAIAAGRYEDALEALQRIDPDGITRLEIKRDLEFYKALATARMALAGGGDPKEARKLMESFGKTASDSYHYLEACEVVGDLLVSQGEFAAAEAYYAPLAKAPWPDYKMRAGVALGRAQLADGKVADAMKSFQAVSKMDAAGARADRQRLEASLGQARCLIHQKQHDEAVRLAEDVVNKADPEQAPLLAPAYNVLGAAHREAGRPEEALLAFLHVDVLYSYSPADHLVALENLHQLWTQLQKPERAAQAAETLRERYKVQPTTP